MILNAAEEAVNRARQAALCYVQESISWADRYNYGQLLNATLPLLARRDWLGLFTVARTRGRLPKVRIARK